MVEEEKSPFLKPERPMPFKCSNDSKNRKIIRTQFLNPLIIDSKKLCPNPSNMYMLSSMAGKPAGSFELKFQPNMAQLAGTARTEL